MRIRLSNKIGFCFGVKRAVKMAQDALKRKGDIYSLGSIIHNKQVVKDLSAAGLKVVGDAGKIGRGVVVISSHGLSPRVSQDIAKRGVKIIDTTCPFVSNAQRIAKRLGREGYRVIIVGDAGHPEVKALVDFVPGSGAAGRVTVVKDKEGVGACRFDRHEKIGIISQTTQSTANFLEVVKAVLDKGLRETRVFNTICNDAEARQMLAGRLAGGVDLMLIVGGKNSANTRRLFEVCRSILKDSYLVETDKDVREGWFAGKRSIGITSGASTPEWIIKKVVCRIKNLKKGVV